MLPTTYPDHTRLPSPFTRRWIIAENSFSHKTNPTQPKIDVKG